MILLILLHKTIVWIQIYFEIRDANTVGTVASKGKPKATKAKKKREFDLITLSSDEEEEVEDDEGKEEDEVEFLAEMEGHFFGNQDTDASEVCFGFVKYLEKLIGTLRPERFQ